MAVRNGPARIARVDRVWRRAEWARQRLGLVGAGSDVQIPKEKQEYNANDEAEIEQRHEFSPPRDSRASGTAAGQEWLRVVVVVVVVMMRRRLVPDTRQPAVSRAGGALPVGAIRILVCVDTRVGIVADARHAFWEAFLVVIVS